MMSVSRVSRVSRGGAMPSDDDDDRHDAKTTTTTTTPTTPPLVGRVNESGNESESGIESGIESESVIWSAEANGSESEAFTQKTKNEEMKNGWAGLGMG